MEQEQKNKCQKLLKGTSIKKRNVFQLKNNVNQFKRYCNQAFQGKVKSHIKLSMSRNKVIK